MRFEFLDHTADISVRLEAESFEALIEAAARALREILVEDRGAGVESAPAAHPPSVAGRIEVPLAIEAEDRESLLVDCLNEILYLFDARELVPAGIRSVRVAGGRGALRLEAVLEAERFEPARHARKSEVKAATFHGLEVRETTEGVLAEVVFDV